MREVVFGEVVRRDVDEVCRCEPEDWRGVEVWRAGAERAGAERAGAELWRAGAELWRGAAGAGL